MSRNFELLQRAEQERHVERQSSLRQIPVPGAQASAASTQAQEGPASELCSSLNGSSRDEVRKLVQRLFLRDEGCRAVVFAGTERHTGCTWVAAHVAQLLAAQSTGSVCIVDANLRFPAMHDFFQVENHHGLSDALLGVGPLQEFVQRLPVPNLWLLSCGSAVRNEEALTASEALRARLQQVRAQFDFVVIDTPPASSHHDALMAGAATDGIVLVIKANTSRRETAQQITREAKAANVRLLGAILNQRTFPVPEKIYKRL